MSEFKRSRPPFAPCGWSGTTPWETPCGVEERLLEGRSATQSPFFPLVTGWIPQAPRKVAMHAGPDRLFTMTEVRHMFFSPAGAFAPLKRSVRSKPGGWYTCRVVTAFDSLTPRRPSANPLASLAPSRRIRHRSCIPEPDCYSPGPARCSIRETSSLVSVRWRCIDSSCGQRDAIYDHCGPGRHRRIPLDAESVFRACFSW